MRCFCRAGRRLAARKTRLSLSKNRLALSSPPPTAGGLHKEPGQPPAHALRKREDKNTHHPAPPVPSNAASAPRRRRRRRRQQCARHPVPAAPAGRGRGRRAAQAGNGCAHVLRQCMFVSVRGKVACFFFSCSVGHATETAVCCCRPVRLLLLHSSSILFSWIVCASAGHHSVAPLSPHKHPPPGAHVLPLHARLHAQASLAAFPPPRFRYSGA